jgi:hypothetical protein
VPGLSFGDSEGISTVVQHTNRTNVHAKSTAGRSQGSGEQSLSKISAEGVRCAAADTQKKNVSRVELVKLTGLSAGLITGITHALISKGLVTEALGRPSTAGRKPLALKVRHEAAYVVGVDLGSFYLRVVATDILGNLVYKLRTETRIQRRTPAQ